MSTLEPESLLEVADLSVTFRRPDGQLVHAVAEASFSVGVGQTVAIVGESGSGKSVSTRAIMGLLPPNATVRGSILYRGAELVGLDQRGFRALRGSKVSLVPQDAMAALDPLMTVGHQIAEMFLVHTKVPAAEALERAVQLMERVGIESASRRAADLPHSFSGGMRQRLVIAMAVALRPDLLIADEATSALDVSIQLDVLDMLRDLRRELGMSMIYVTHDLLSIRDIADYVVVMYAGRVMERGRVEAVFTKPTHPYTEALLLSTPRFGGSLDDLRPIQGNPPGLDRDIVGCPFAPRCEYAADVCFAERPALRTNEGGTTSACHFSPDLFLVGQGAHAW